MLSIAKAREDGMKGHASLVAAPVRRRSPVRRSGNEIKGPPRKFDSENPAFASVVPAWARSPTCALARGLR